MAEKYEGSFVSKRVLDKERESRRSYLDEKLEKVLYYAFASIMVVFTARRTNRLPVIIIRSQLST